MNFSKFTSKLSLLFFIYIVLTLGACQNPSTINTNALKLWYQQPAQTWLEAMPIGNGKLGAMVYGVPKRERLQLNEESLWGGCPEDPIPENAKEHYANFQKLNLEGEFEKALNYAMHNLAISPTSIRSYQTFGELFISFSNHENIDDYKRDLNLQTGINTVQYSINGKRFIRESFISTKYNTIFHHFKSLDGEMVTSEINYEREKDVKQRIENNTLIIDGQIFDDPNGYDDNAGGSGEGGYHMKFAANIFIKLNRGELKSSGNKLIVNNSDEFTVMISAATDYNLDIMNFDREIDPLSICEQTIQQASKVDYAKIKAEHIASHAAIMNRVLFDITPASLLDTIPTDVRLKNLKEKKEDKHLTELLFQYGRYLLLSSSGGNSVLPANLQGIWNNEMWAAWDSDFHLNINLQMNYWAADICNLGETTRPLSLFMKNLSEKGKVTASNFLDTDGWMAHHASNPFGRTTASGSTKLSQVNNGYSFPLAGAWMSLSLWRHYEFAQEEKYLRDIAYPVLSGAAKFILDFLSENEKGELVTAPSYSPENTYIDPRTGKKIKNTVAATIDMQLIRDIFKACIASEKILNQETELTALITDAIKKLPEIKIGKDGTIQEWYQDYEEVEVGHRHISHLYALYPSNQINSSTPKLFEAAKKTLERRLSDDQQTGWSRAWMINFYARLGNGDESYKHISKLLENQVSSNLFDLIYPNSTIFQIDGNLGATAGIAEMLIQSQSGEIILLPALPKEWKNGEVKGLCAKGGFVVDMKWESGALSNVKIYSKNGGTCMIEYKGKGISFETEIKKEYFPMQERKNIW
jgi:alpha-L-fucosidase 2